VVCPTEDKGCCPIEDKGCCSIEDKGYYPTEDNGCCLAEDKGCYPIEDKKLTNRLEPIIQAKPIPEPKPSTTILI
jgi:hypothetical protein